MAFAALFTADKSWNWNRGKYASGKQHFGFSLIEMCKRINRSPRPPQKHTHTLVCQHVRCRHVRVALIVPSEESQFSSPPDSLVLLLAPASYWLSDKNNSSENLQRRGARGRTVRRVGVVAAALLLVMAFVLPTSACQGDGKRRPDKMQPLGIEGFYCHKHQFSVG